MAKSLISQGVAESEKHFSAPVIQTGSVSPGKIKQIQQNDRRNHVLIYNRGRPIDLTNRDGKSSNQLFAVCLGQEGNITYESYVFSDREKMGKAEVNKSLNRLEIQMRKDYGNYLLTLGSGEENVRYFNYYFSQRWRGEDAFFLASVIRCVKQAGRADMDGKAAEIWTIGNSQTAAETFNRYDIAKQTVWFSPKASEHLLLSWNDGQYIDVSKKEGVLSALKYRLMRTKWKDCSSKTGNYGKWEIYPSAKEKRFLCTGPGIEVGTTDNTLAVKVRHQAVITKGLWPKQAFTFDTGTFCFPLGTGART